MMKTKAYATVGVILLLLLLASSLIQSVKASSYWSATWHSGRYENYPGYPENRSTTTTVYSAGYEVKVALVVSIYQYEPYVDRDMVIFKTCLYFDSFADEGLYPVPAEYVTFFIDKDAYGSNLDDQKISAEKDFDDPGFVQSYGLYQWGSTIGSDYEERAGAALKVLDFAVGLIFEPIDVATDLIDLAFAFAPDEAIDYKDADWPATDTRAYCWWHCLGCDFDDANPVRQYAFNTIRWFQKYNVEPDTYYGVKVWASVKLPLNNPLGVNYINLSPVSLRIFPSGGGGGGGEPCPILSVYDGAEYVEEGLLDIHNPDCMDEVTSRVLTVTPEAVEHRYLMRLTEHPQTHSHIDQVQVFATINGTEMKLPLVSAVHSADGNVLLELLLSDDIRADMLGADHNNGTSEYIDLKFVAPEGLEIEEFTFIIEGYNPEFK